MPLNEVIYCMIHPDRGPVTITLRANNALAAGSKFALWQSDGTTQREAWDLSAGDTGEGKYPIGASVDTLANNYMTWTITVCAVHAAVDTGIVEIEVSQGGVSCPLTKDLQWSLEDVPQCDVTGDNVIKIQRSLTFRNA